MKKYLLPFILTIILLACGSALAEDYVFENIHASFTAPSGYEPVLTKSNLSSYESLLLDREGLTSTEMAERFENEGILLIAYDDQNDRKLIITAMQDVDAQQYFDLNDQDSEMRRKYRVSHADGTAYGLLGYKYESAAWKNYGGNSGRFLMLKYVLRQEGAVYCRGYQRRTIRNGYTVTLDLQVFGRQLTGKDNTAINKIQDAFTFTQVLAASSLPPILSIDSAPPIETSSAAFTVKGTTGKGATVNLLLTTLSGSGAQTFTTTAKTSGAFALEVTLPSEGVYHALITTETDGMTGDTADYDITYQKGLLPVNVTQAFPENVNEDSVKIAGTTGSGVTVEMVVGGKSTVKKTGANGAFTFTVDTSAEGTYDVTLNFSKKNYESRSAHYTGVRAFTDAQKNEQIKKSASSPKYSQLSKNLDSYDGKTLKYTGVVTSVQEVAGSYVLFIALTKTDAGYEDSIVVTCENDPGVAVGDTKTMYGISVGGHYTRADDGTDLINPMFELIFFE